MSDTPVPAVPEDGPLPPDTTEGPPAFMSSELRLAGRINRLAQVLERPFQQQVSNQYEITLSDWRVLVQIVQRPGVSGSEIATTTALPAMSVSRSVQTLRTTGRVTSKVDPRDSRRRRLFATREGQDLYDHIAPQALEDITRVMDVLNPDEKTFFLALVDRLNRRSDELLP
ncbi:MarR family winged helix-turn-helix transcriptional regulator [Citricoccus sp. NPDC055426]|uniref:MarR family winged helix-turn-helix transcriptional regulator n=1 Tax=Citricoccus sp. NPDC055426 TaxID=3155536 RepID=UPI003420ADFC